MPLSDAITMPVPEFCRVSGIGHSRLYDLINTGEIESVLIGRRRLIVVDSYRAYLTRLQKEGSALGPSPNPRARRPAAQAP
ncbi:MAG: hypothetical protein ACREFK_03670 [Stellaceae bacterium]